MTESMRLFSIRSKNTKSGSHYIVAPNAEDAVEYGWKRCAVHKKNIVINDITDTTVSPYDGGLQEILDGGKTAFVVRYINRDCTGQGVLDRLLGKKPAETGPVHVWKIIDGVNAK